MKTILRLFLFLLVTLFPARDGWSRQQPAVPEPSIVTAGAPSPDTMAPLYGVWKFTYQASGTITHTFTFDTICFEGGNDFVMRGADEQGTEIVVTYDDTFLKQFILINPDTFDTFVFTVAGDTAEGSYYSLDPEGEATDVFTRFTGKRTQKVQPLDADTDGIGDACDNCPDTANTSQQDTDDDGQGNACDTDADNDGIDNSQDNCLYIANTEQSDSDSDGIGNECDNCPNAANQDQADTDRDGRGDSCDPTDDTPPDPPADTLCPAELVLGAGAADLAVLRTFRDTKLVKSAAGRLLVDMYTTASPSLVQWLRGSPCLQAAAQKILKTLVPFMAALCQNP